MIGVADHASAQAGEARRREIVEVLVDHFRDLLVADPEAFRHKFREMAASPFAFYRGSATLFYADMAREPDMPADPRAARVWIQGDLHAENSAAAWTLPAHWSSTSTTSTRPASGTSPGLSRA